VNLENDRFSGTVAALVGHGAHEHGTEGAKKAGKTLVTLDTRTGDVGRTPLSKVLFQEAGNVIPRTSPMIRTERQACDDLMYRHL